MICQGCRGFRSQRCRVMPRDQLVLYTMMWSAPSSPATFDAVPLFILLTMERFARCKLLPSCQWLQVLVHVQVWSQLASYGEAGAWKPLSLLIGEADAKPKAGGSGRILWYSDGRSWRQFSSGLNQGIRQMALSDNRDNRVPRVPSKFHGWPSFSSDVLEPG